MKRIFHRQLSGVGVTGSTVVIEDESPPKGFIYLINLISVRNSTTSTSDVEIGVHDGSKFIAFFRTNNPPSGEFVLASDDVLAVDEYSHLRAEWFNTVDGDTLNISLQYSLAPVD